jgi:ABC-type transporter MlaC component
MTCPPLPRTLPILASLLALLAQAPLALAQSAILESVRQNPEQAKALCQQLRQLNAQGVSSTSQEAVRMVAQQQSLSMMDAEVLTTYVVGLHCPDVR